MRENSLVSGNNVTWEQDSFTGVFHPCSFRGREGHNHVFLILLPQPLVSHSVAKAGFELMVILLPQSSMCWNHRCEFLCLAFLTLEISANKTVHAEQISLWSYMLALGEASWLEDEDSPSPCGEQNYIFTEKGNEVKMNVFPISHCGRLRRFLPNPSVKSSCP